MDRKQKIRVSDSELAMIERNVMRGIVRAVRGMFLLDHVEGPKDHRIVNPTDLNLDLKAGNIKGLLRELTANTATVGTDELQMEMLIGRALRNGNGRTTEFEFLQRGRAKRHGNGRSKLNAAV